MALTMSLQLSPQQEWGCDACRPYPTPHVDKPSPHTGLRMRRPTSVIGGKAELTLLPLLTDAVDKVGDERRAGNNRIQVPSFLNLYCAPDSYLESMLLNCSSKNVYRQHRSKADMNLANVDVRFLRLNGLVLWLPQLAILVTGPFSDLSRSLLRIISFHSLGKGRSRGRCKQYDLGTLPSLPMPTSGMGH